MRACARRAWAAGLALLAVAGSPALAAADAGDKVTWTRIAGVSAVTGWGVAQWDYFRRDPHTTREGWFGAGTSEGGADKFGHLYASYVFAQGLGELYEGWGLSRDAAARQATLTSLLVLGVMEVGDSFSPTYGFSAEDEAMNVLGAAAGYGLRRSETWRHRLDLRVEYEPSGAGDPFTDYGHDKFLVALKLDGFATLAGGPLAWLELQAGYYARGYDSPDAPDSRHVYAGIALNLPRLFARAGWPRTGVLFRFWQPPHTVLAAERDLDR